jgi:hypothetical protein
MRGRLDESFSFLQSIILPDRKPWRSGLEPLANERGAVGIVSKNTGAVAVERAGIDAAMHAVVDAPFPPPRWPGGAPRSCRDLHDQPGRVHTVIYQNPVWGQSQHKRQPVNMDL